MAEEKVGSASREIKFRAWCPSKRVMFQVGDDFGTISPLDPVVYFKQGQDVNLLQFTGLEDKNGKEIYEGDIVRIPHWTRGVRCPRCGYTESEDGFAVIAFSNYESTDDGGRSLATFTIRIRGDEYPLDNAEYYEVIGNIYENPELVKP